MATRRSTTIDGTPEKHIFRGMIADYSLTTGLCELVDNAFDHWIESGRASGLRIEVTLDQDRQIILVKDNAGGVPESDLRLLIAPGASRNASVESLIGIFGVGGKRAGVALGEMVQIRSRHRGSKTYRIDIDNDWLQDDSWDIECVEAPPITKGSTVVEISKLRQPFTQRDIDRLLPTLGETYGWFLDQGCEIVLNDISVGSKRFDVWSYPPEFPPRRLNFVIQPDGSRDLQVEMEAGLIADRDPEGENYGVYIFCNHRLIVKEMRERDVGYFVTGEAGVPHPDASLCRVIVRLHGNPELMPWNSSKSDVNIAHPSFKQLRSNVISLVTYYSKLSRRLKNNWDDVVFSHTSGDVETVDPTDVAAGHKLILPQLPRARKVKYVDALRQLNAGKVAKEAHTLGLVEAMGMVDVLSRQKLETKNRAALILLDSNFEIALKEFIVHDTNLFPPREYSDAKIKHIFGQRTTVIREVQAKVPALTDDIVNRAAYFYGLRNKLIHERTTIPINDREIADYSFLVEQVLRMLFGIRFPRR